ncbi:hypothetical protein G9A89_002284 [Geosiphon pyriformis]|nr:hypothetical protein G9A89_002284 [Geosiphon pyriformis]
MSEYLSFLGWTFLPQLVTNWLQSLYYKLSYPVGANVPKPGQQKYSRHHSRIYAFVVLAYLAYTIIQVDQSIQPNYYKLLDLGRDFTDKELKTNSRKLHLQYHPDKNPGEEAKAIFIVIRTAYDTLSDPVKRFAYDRFGPDIERWDHSKTIRDYLYNGWSSFVEFYLGTGLLLLILNILGKGQFGRFWRFVVFFAMGCLEATMILHPKPPLILSLLIPHRVIFEQITILRQIFITTFIGLSQVGPVLFPSESTDFREPLQRLDILSNIVAEEATNHVRAGFEPFARDPQGRADLKRKMEKLAMDSYLYTDPEFNRMYSQAHQRMVSRRKNPRV